MFIFLRTHQSLLLQFFFAAVVVISFILNILEILSQPGAFQWDLNVYYIGPLEFLQGVDPYKISRFVYPPVYLFVFKVFSTWFSYEQFYQVFLFTKTVCFFGLLWIWKTFFFSRVPIGTFMLFIWLGLYATFLLDFQAGNISVFETTLLFLAFICFLKNRLGLFVIFILCVSSLKLTPLFFLILLPLSSKKNWRLFVLGCLGFLFYGLCNFLIYPELTRTFVAEALSRTSETGVISPSSFAFMTDAWRSLLSNWPGLPAGIISKTTYLVFVVYVFRRSWHSWKQSQKKGLQTQNERLFLVLFSILVYTVTMPRMKDYAYMIAIPSLLHAVYEHHFRIPRWVLFIPLIIIPTTTTQPLVFQAVFQQFWTYYPLLLATLFWSFYLKIPWQPQDGVRSDRS